MITQQQIDDLVADINDILEEDRAKLKMSFHFAVDRLNDPRNKPPITLAVLTGGRLLMLIPILLLMKVDYDSLCYDR